MDQMENPQDKPQKLSFWKAFRNYFREYCQSSSIHGFRYFGEKRTVFERVWWFFVFTVCLTACVFSIYLVYKKWEQSPVIVSFATRGTPIYDIPFPAVTICPESKMDQELFNWTYVINRKSKNESITEAQWRKIKNITTATKCLTEINIYIFNIRKTMYQYMKLLCDDSDLVNTETDNNNYTFSDHFYEFLDKISPKTIDRMFNCNFMDMDCSKMFTPTMTDEGICYSFNMLSSREIFRENVQQFYQDSQLNHSVYTIQDGYDPDAGIGTYPYRALLAGAKSALELNLVTPKADIDHACMDTVPVQGYRVLLHTAMRIPRPGQQYFRVPLDQVVSASVQPVMITTSESVKSYSPARRQCYFPSERYLKYFRTYTSLNCQLECLTNHTLALCDCVQFFMPKENGTRICGPGSFECQKMAEDLMHFGHLDQNINARRESANVEISDCDCKPICSDLSYDAFTSQTPYDWKNNLKARGLLPGNITEDEIHVSGLIIYFKSDNFITSERNELYGPTDFLANFGGLLGLFTGFSVLSLMEILYFMSVRLICNLRLYGHWAGD